MTTDNRQRVYLDDLARRWRQDGDWILDLAINNTLPLWVQLASVFLEPAAPPTGKERKRKTPAKTYHDQVEVRLQPEVLMQVLGRQDRMLIAAELACLDAKGKAVAVTNSAGEEWGETSMIALKPTTLFARMADVLAYEQANGLSIAAENTVTVCVANTAIGQEGTANRPDHPCHAPELDIALRCWQALFGQSTSPDTDKQSILAWLREHYPHLSRAAGERIAQVVMPAARKRC